MSNYEFAAGGPPLTSSEVQAVEQNSRADSRNRRLTLAALMLSGARLTELADDDEAAQGLSDALVCARALEAHCRQLVELARTAAARLEFALGKRADMPELIEAAERRGVPERIGCE